MRFDHTPGTWLATVYLDVVAEDGSPIARLASTRGKYEDEEANARLISAAPDLLEAQTMGVEVSTPDFLDWIASRLVNHYGESPNVDFVLSLRDRASAGRAAIAKATGETP